MNYSVGYIQASNNNGDCKFEHNMHFTYFGRLVKEKMSNLTTLSQDTGSSNSNA